MAANSLDFEEIRSYRFSVTAQDMGTNVLTDEVEVVITVLDENDNSPIFVPAEYTADVAEGNYNETSYTPIVLVRPTHMLLLMYANLLYICRSMLLILTLKTLVMFLMKCFQKMISS